ncbi:MAG: tryptophan--tRNA ligase [Nanobdellota archaeon]
MTNIDAWGSVKIENYEHVFKEFGLKKFEFKEISKNYLIQRGMIIAHRDFDKIKEAIATNSKFLQLTGIASTGKLHLGHKVDIDFFRLFKSLGASGKFCVCDIDAYVSRPKVKDMDTAKEFAVDNVADALALGLDKEDLYVQSQKEKEYFTFSYEISKKITKNMFEAIYGHVDLGKVSAVFLQIADILHIQLPFMYGKAPTITGIGLDQDPHARITRDISRYYDMNIPSFFYFLHQSGLKEGSKMSSSEPDTAIFLEDTSKEVKRKINKSYTGGRDSVEEQKEKGGDPDICKVHEIYRFHHPDDSFVDGIYTDCKKGNLLCGECKKKCIEFLNDFLEKHQNKKKESIEKANKIVYGSSD